MEKYKEGFEAHLHRSWVEKLAYWWGHYNWLYLNEAMRTPVLRLGQGEGHLGHWDGRWRVLSISEAHIARDPWLSVMDTLRHEMAHQYVDEVLKVRDEAPHGPAFFHTCKKLRCSPEARAGAEDLQAPAVAEDRILRVLQKVLSLAGSPNENEAQAAMQKAHALLMKYNIDLVALDHPRRFDTRSLGPVKGRHTSAENWLGSLLSRFFFVEVLWLQTYDAARDQVGTVLQIYGTPENLDMAAYVYDYLTHLLDGLWMRYRADKQMRGNRERQRYCAGVLAGFYQKLETQEKSLAQSDALVWRGDAQLKAHFHYVNPSIHTRYGGGVRATDAYKDGIQDGRQVTIHRPVGEAGTGVKGLLG